MKKLEGKVSVVTAATRGIGLECVKTLAENGSLVYIAARKLDVANEIANELNQNGRNVKIVYFDAAEEESYTNFIKEIIENEKKIDILINNYGTTDVKKDFDLLNGDIKSFMKIIETNLKSVYLPSKIAVENMIKNKSGNIINISSIGSVIPDISRTAYGVSKAAINFLTKDIAIQYADKGIRCNAILPGLIATDAAINNMSEEFRENFLKHVPLNRFGTAKDIANTAVFLASEESSFITGEIIEVGGGYGKGTPLYGDRIIK